MAKGKKKDKGDGGLLRRYSDFKLYPNKEVSKALWDIKFDLALLYNALIHQREMGSFGYYVPLIDCFFKPARIDLDGDERAAYLRAMDRRHQELVKEAAENGTQYRFLESTCITLAVDEDGNKIRRSSEITLLREAAPDKWGRISSDTMAQVAVAVDEAFKRFFAEMKRLGDESYYRKKAADFQARRGRMPTRFELAGYPRRKRPSVDGGIPFRERTKGWDISHVGGPNWRLHVKGVTNVRDKSTWIKMRGKFPCDPKSIRDMDIKLINDSWMASIAIEMIRERHHGACDATVTIGGIGEEFVRVTYSADGRRAAGCDDGIIPSEERSAIMAQQVSPESPEAGLDSGAGDGTCSTGRPRLPPEAGLDSGAGDGEVVGRCAEVEPEAGLDSGALIASMQAEQIRIDAMKSERDSRYRAPAPGVRPSSRWKKATSIIRKAETKLTRRRNELIHKMTNEVVSRSAGVTVVSPPAIKEVTRTAKGNVREFGGAVELVAKVNRSILSAAPYRIKTTLKYKAEEAKIGYVETENERPEVSRIRVASTHAKLARKVRRSVKRASREAAAA